MKMLLGLLALPSVVLSIALSDFQPQATGLTESCQRAYTLQIPSCQQADFLPEPNCSPACANGLISMQNTIFQACSGDARNNQQLIGAFLSNKGPTALCPNIVFTVNPEPAPTTAAATPSASSVDSTTTSTIKLTTTIKTTRVVTIPKSGATNTATLSTSTPTSLSSLLSSAKSSLSVNAGGSTTATSSPNSMLSTTDSLTIASATGTANAFNAPSCEQGDRSDHGGSLLDNSCTLSSGSVATFQSIHQSTILIALALFGCAHILV